VAITNRPLESDEGRARELLNGVFAREKAVDSVQQHLPALKVVHHVLKLVLIPNFGLSFFYSAASLLRASARLLGAVEGHTSEKSAGVICLFFSYDPEEGFCPLLRDEALFELAEGGRSFLASSGTGWSC